ncbi:MAG: hypothetical protein SPJ19_02320 [Candidatus Borkfalkiaceae bacterium]|nr:hypothetical protein [Christensenellaceae bacterium]
MFKNFNPDGFRQESPSKATELTSLICYPTNKKDGNSLATSVTRYCAIAQDYARQESPSKATELTSLICYPPNKKDGNSLATNVTRYCATAQDFAHQGKSVKGDRTDKLNLLSHK